MQAPPFVISFSFSIQVSCPHLLFPDFLCVFPKCTYNALIKRDYIGLYVIVPLLGSELLRSGDLAYIFKSLVPSVRTGACQILVSIGITHRVSWARFPKSLLQEVCGKAWKSAFSARFTWMLVLLVWGQILRTSAMYYTTVSSHWIHLCDIAYMVTCTSCAISQNLGFNHSSLSWKTLDKWLMCSEPRLPHLKNGHSNKMLKHSPRCCM